MTAPMLFVDGVCNLCNGFVLFIVDRDPDGVFKFASLQSSFAEAQLRPRGFDPAKLESVALVLGDRVLTKSDAVLAVVARLRSPWRILAWTRVVPRPLRDLVYDVVARLRYRVFGKTETCRVPTPELRGRFLDVAA